MPTVHVINGRFGTQRMSGVQRVAWGLLQALDARDDLPGHWELLAPPGCTWPPLRQLALRRRGWGGMPGHLWEQTFPAMAARRGERLLNLAGSGPWFGGPQVSWLHDAAVFDQPDAYQPAFVGWYRALFRHRARRGDLLITPSLHARERLAHHLGVPAARLAVLTHGGDHLDAVPADPTVLARLGLQHRGFWLCVASRNPNKNLTRLLQAHRVAQVPGLPLVLVGGEHPPVFAAVRPSGPDTGVVQLPHASDGEIKALMQGARALLMPSLVEGFGLPALEAMRLGCAVVAARAGALPEVCGDAALYVDPLSVDDIAAALALLARDEPLRARLQAAGATRAAPFTWARAAGELLALLRGTAA